MLLHITSKRPPLPFDTVIADTLSSNHASSRRPVRLAAAHSRIEPMVLELTRKNLARDTQTRRIGSNSILCD